MREWAVVGAAFLGLVALWVYTASAADPVSGAWNVEVTGAIASSCTAEVQRQGKDLTGTVTCPQAGLRLPIRGTITGSTAVNTARGDLGWTASMSGDTASGTYQGTMGAGSWTAVRQVAE